MNLVSAFIHNKKVLEHSQIAQHCLFTRFQPLHASNVAICISRIPKYFGKSPHNWQGSHPRLSFPLKQDSKPSLSHRMASGLSGFRDEQSFHKRGIGMVLIEVDTVCEIFQRLRLIQRSILYVPLLIRFRPFLHIIMLCVRKVHPIHAGHVTHSFCRTSMQGRANFGMSPKPISTTYSVSSTVATNDICEFSRAQPFGLMTVADIAPTLNP